MKQLGPPGVLICVVVLLWNKVKYLEQKTKKMSEEMQPKSQCKLMHHIIEEKVTMLSDQILEEQREIKDDIRDIRDKVDEKFTKILDVLSKQKE